MFRLALGLRGPGSRSARTAKSTEFWPLCVSGAGLGLKLYGGVHGKRTHWAYERWVDCAHKHYMGHDRKGTLDWFAFYYDPREKSLFTFRDDVAAYAALAITPYVVPQDLAFGTQLYDMAVQKLGWNNPRLPLLQLHPDPRWLTSGLLMARELGDAITENRPPRQAEDAFEPRFFGAGSISSGQGVNLSRPIGRQAAV